MSDYRMITRQDVCRLAISQQHLDGGKRPSLLDMVRDMGCVQLDPISAVERSHLLVLWSRLGQQFDPMELDKLLWQDKQLFEYWAHAASIVLTEEFPVHQWYMQRRANEDPSKSRYKKWLDSNPDKLYPLQDFVLNYLRKNPPSLSRDIKPEGEKPNGNKSRWYSGRDVPHILDAMWTRGVVSIVGRQGKQRKWGMADTWFPDWTPRDVWDEVQLTRFAVQKAVKALGVATPQQIKKHYTRNRYPQMGNVIKELVADGLLEQVSVVEDGEMLEGELLKGELLKGEWYVHTAVLPQLEQIQQGNWQPRTALLSPFDNLICDRDRTELLFDYYFRIEIYVPAAKRQYGYYVLPILQGDRLIGRIDPKMDRKSGVLQVHNVYMEDGAPEDAATANAIGEQIKGLARFLGATAV
ncbi:MAG: winged helix-turn-helix domain-containing protein, partial [Chloroflexi bacterium]|nr:winged helix-turn-helix domain-containing protein [Chloroflexota bacterium]